MIKTAWLNLYHFTLKQAWASLFGFLLLVAMVLTMLFDTSLFYRYDILFVIAILIQLVLIVIKLETWPEVYVIFGFHLVATIMELYKTSSFIGSWVYPEPARIALFGVPLFAGFMYSAVGSYIARAWKLLNFRFTNYPPVLYTIILAVLIYLNFFTHHFIFDFRYILLAAALGLFWKTHIYYTPYTTLSMPLPLGFLLVSLFIWIAENIATYSNVWLYPHQVMVWQWVSPHKITAWFLLMIISFVLVSFIYRQELESND